MITGHMKDFEDCDYSVRIAKAASPECSCRYRRYLVNAGTSAEHTEVQLDQEDLNCPVHQSKAV